MDKSQESLQSRNGVLFFLAVNQLMLSVMSIVLSFPLERNGDPQRAPMRFRLPRSCLFVFNTRKNRRSVWKSLLRLHTGMRVVW